MIRFLYTTDPHTKGRSPSTRVDDFPRTIEKKLMNFFEMGHELNVDFFALGGDFVDSAYTSNKYVQHLGRIFKEGLRDKEMFHVWGNHDVIAWNPNTIDETAFGLFESFFENMTLLTKQPISRTYNGQSIELSGVSSYSRLDRHITMDDDETILEHRSRDYVVEEDNGVPRVHIVHGYLSPKPILDDIPHTVIDEMKHTKASITLTGHEHTGFPVTKLDHGSVFNPGALGRVFASHTEMNRMPQYALCTIHDDGTEEIEPIQCPVAEKGTVVMDRTALDEKKAKEELLVQARGNIQEVLKTINIEGIDIRTIMTRFKDEVRPEVYKEADRRLNFKKGR